jgi:site-specific recombinase XerC
MMLSECSEWLAGLGYSPGSAAGVVNVLERLSWWMQLAGAEVDDIDEDLLARFLAVEGSRDLPCVAVKRWIGTMRRFLTAAGYLSSVGVQSDPLTPAQTAVADWCSWMREQRGLIEKTIAARCHYAASLLDVLMAADGSMQWWRLDASLINAYVAERGRPYGIVARAHIVGSVRCLLRWALSTGRLDRDLTAGILKPAGTRRSLPRGVDTDQVAALLGVCDGATALGARDRTLVMILVRCGLRAGEAARLRLDDIDWAGGHLRVTGKGREHSLPLPVDVGQALEAWLRLRPPAVDRAVFVRMRAPAR